MNWFDCVTTLIATVGFSWMAYELFFMQKLELDVARRRNIPQTLVDFPIHNGFLSEYEISKQKVEEFKFAVLAGDENIQLSLSQVDINNLYTQGMTLNKYIPGNYLFYTIEGNFVVEDSIRWPDPGSPNAIWSRRSLLSFTFSEDDGKLVMRNKVITERELSFDSKPSVYSLKNSSLILFIFDGSKEPNRRVETTTVEFQKALSVIERIRYINLENGCLTITAN